MSNILTIVMLVIMGIVGGLSSIVLVLSFPVVSGKFIEKSDMDTPYMIKKDSGFLSGVFYMMSSVDVI